MAGPKLFVIIEFYCINRRLHSYNEKQTAFFSSWFIIPEMFLLNWRERFRMNCFNSTMRTLNQNLFFNQIDKNGFKQCFYFYCIYISVEVIIFQRGSCTRNWIYPPPSYLKKDEKSCKHCNSIFLIVTNNLWTNSIWFIKYASKICFSAESFFNGFILS
jgi:hypothetical protein